MFDMDLDDLDDEAAAAGGKNETATGNNSMEEGQGTPVLLCFFSSGQTKQQGTAQLQKLINDAAKAGLTDSLVIGHTTEEEYKACNDWESYRNAMVAELEKVYMGRPVIIFAHSRGTWLAYGVAGALGKRVRKVYVVASRSPGTPVLDDAFGVSRASDMEQLGDAALLKAMMATWRNPFFEAHKDEDENQYPASLKSVLDICRSHYSTPCVPSGSKDHLTISKGGRIHAPIMAVACSQELPKGETASKMEEWAEFTSDKFELKSIDSDHLTCLKKKLFDMVLEDMKQFI